MRSVCLFCLAKSSKASLSHWAFRVAFLTHHVCYNVAVVLVVALKALEVMHMSITREKASTTPCSKW